MRIFLLLSIALLVSCTGLPEGIEPVKNLEQDRYLGKWYEIARLDHSFERGLSQVTANYSLQEDGSIKVINRGFSDEKQEWQEAEGKALFVSDANIGHLKVSFFGPFYGSYVIFKLDTIDYQYAYVTSHNRDYLWLLSRQPQVSEELKTDFLKTTRNLGFKVEDIIFVEQSVTE